jgi:hypothetical protein
MLSRLATSGACVTLGASRCMSDNRYQRLVFYHELKIFGNRLMVVLVGAPYRMFRSTLQGLNQLVAGLSPLSETTYPTSHEIPNDGS